MYFSPKSSFTPRTHHPYLTQRETNYCSVPSSIDTIRTKIQKYENIFDKIYSSTNPTNKYEEYKKQMQLQMQRDLKPKQKNPPKQIRNVTRRQDSNTQRNRNKKYNYLQMFNKEIEELQQKEEEQEQKMPPLIRIQKPSTEDRKKFYQSTNDSAQDSNDDSLDKLQLDVDDGLEITQFTEKDAHHFSNIQKLKADIFRLMELESKLDEKLGKNEEKGRGQQIHFENECNNSLDDSLEKIKDIHNQTATFNAPILIHEDIEEFSFSQ